MSIQFKAYNEKEYSSVNIPGSHISCLKLKELLINKLRIGMKSDFRFTLLDEEGKKEYPDNYLIMKNSCVLYKIESLTDRNQDGVLATINNAKRHYRPEPTTSSASASATAYTSNVIPSTAVPLSGSSSLIGSAALPVEVHDPDVIPPPNYLCPRCLVSGHYEEYCPTRFDSSWPEKMREWNFKISRGNPIERLKKIEDPNTIALLIKQGNLVVRHPEGNHHLCLVKREAPAGVEKESSKKITPPEIFYCYGKEHFITDAVILPCCCQVIGCREHITNIVVDNGKCPVCHQEVTIKNIKEFPILNRSIEKFLQEMRLSSKASNSASTYDDRRYSVSPRRPHRYHHHSSRESRDRRRSRSRSRSRSYRR